MALPRPRDDRHCAGAGVDDAILLGLHAEPPEHRAQEEAEDRALELVVEGHAVGCTKFGALFRILFPLSAPGIVASAIFSFTLAWNEFLLALVFTSDHTTMTVPIKLSMMVVGDQYIWGQLMAGAILASIPIVVLYFLGQRFVVKGLAAGAVKG